MHDSTVTSVDFQLVVQSLFKLPATFFFFFSLFSNSLIILFLDGQDYALKVITETNESWANLVKRSVPAGELSLV